MRILQVLTLLSPSGAYGGVARVALNQGAELAKRGHDVTIMAGNLEYRCPPTELEGVPVRLFTARTLVPGTGFAGLTAPEMVRWFRSHHADFDVVHLHLARGLAVLPLAALARRYRIPYVVQSHGMIVPSRHPLATPLDMLWTRRILRSAGVVCYLTDLERKQIIEVAGPNLSLAQVGNGVPEYPCTAQLSPGAPEVLFVARLHPRKRPMAFIEMAKAVLAVGIDARFTLVGPDEGQGSAVRAAIDDPRICWAGALPPTDIPERLAAAAVYVLPSVQEQYPMSVLEAMSVGLPVVVGNDCGLAPLIERTNSGIIAEQSVSSYAAAVGTLLSDPGMAFAMGQKGRATVRVEHGMREVGDRLTHLYSELVDGRR